MFVFKVATLFHCRNTSIHRTITDKCYSLFIRNTKKCVEVLKPASSAVRCFHDFEINQTVQNSYRKLDDVSNNYKIIYRAPLLNYVRAAHYVTFFTGTFVPIFTLTYLIFNGPFILPVQLGKYPLIRNYFDLTAFYGGLFLMVSQLYVLVQSYPMRVYTDNEGNYIAIYRGIVPWNIKKETFKTGELKKSSSFMPWGDSLYKLKSRKAILLEEHFFRPVDLNNMLGQKADGKNESKSNDVKEKEHQ